MKDKNRIIQEATDCSTTLSLSLSLMSCHYIIQVDLDSHKKQLEAEQRRAKELQLEAEQRRAKELMDKAKDVSDVEEELRNLHQQLANLHVSRQGSCTYL